MQYLICNDKLLIDDFISNLIFSALQEVKLSESLQDPSTLVCPTPGCHGVGNIKGPRYLTHNSLEACPYSPKNIGSESLIPDRLLGNLKQHGGHDEKVDVHV